MIRDEVSGVDDNIVRLAAASTKAVDENYLSARVQIDTIRHALDNLITDLTIIRDNAPRGDVCKADFRHCTARLEKALDYLDAATERLIG